MLDPGQICGVHTITLVHMLCCATNLIVTTVEVALPRTVICILITYVACIKRSDNR